MVWGESFLSFSFNIFLQTSGVNAYFGRSKFRAYFHSFFMQMTFRESVSNIRSVGLQLVWWMSSSEQQMSARMLTDDKIIAYRYLQFVTMLSSSKIGREAYGGAETVNEREVRNS